MFLSLYRHRHDLYRHRHLPFTDTDDLYRHRYVHRHLLNTQTPSSYTGTTSQIDPLMNRLLETYRQTYRERHPVYRLPRGPSESAVGHTDRGRDEGWIAIPPVRLPEATVQMFLVFGPILQGNCPAGPTTPPSRYLFPCHLILILLCRRLAREQMGFLSSTCKSDRWFLSTTCKRDILV